MKIKKYMYSKSMTIKDDFIAGLIVAIIAFPLALGFAIASNVNPAMGVITAIVAGFLAAVFGGSNYQISGPTGAMVVVILSVVTKYGVDGLILATFIAGFILVILGFFKLGKVIEYIPSPVIVGFTSGIAVIIFFGQINNFFGISPQYPPGAEFLQKTIISLINLGKTNIAAFIIGTITVAILLIMPKINKQIPGSIVAVVITSFLVFFFNSFFDIRLVGDIGKIPQSLPIPNLPSMTGNMIFIILPAALTIAALAAIESLLSAVVADGLTDTKHNPNRELIGQGIANIGSALFGGMPATGAIARTATNIRSGGKSKLASVFHAIFLLLFVIALGGIATKIPLATLGGILMFVAFNMVEWGRIRLLFKTPASDILVMLTTFFVTLLVDLTAAIEVGLILAALLFMKRMSDLYKIEEYESGEDKNEFVKKFHHKEISIYTINGPLFFGAASRFDQTVSETPGGHKPIKIIRMKYVPVIDATGLNFIESTAHKHRKMGGVVLFSSVHSDVMKVIHNSGIDKQVGLNHFLPTTRAAIIHALRHAHRLHNEMQEVTKEELGMYNLSALDLEDATKVTKTKDVDPLQGLLDSVSITRIKKLGINAMKHTKKIRKLNKLSLLNKKVKK